MRMASYANAVVAKYKEIQCNCISYPRSTMKISSRSLMISEFFNSNKCRATWWRFREDAKILYVWRQFTSLVFEITLQFPWALWESNRIDVTFARMRMEEPHVRSVVNKLLHLQRNNVSPVTELRYPVTDRTPVQPAYCRSRLKSCVKNTNLLEYFGYGARKRTANNASQISTRSERVKWFKQRQRKGKKL